MRVADRFGRWDVDQFMTEISARQIMEWAAYDNLQAEDQGTAHALQKTLAQTAGAVVKGVKG